MIVDGDGDIPSFTVYTISDPRSHTSPVVTTDHVRLAVDVKIAGCDAFGSGSKISGTDGLVGVHVVKHLGSVVRL
jgi:hypothetical protein